MGRVAVRRQVSGVSPDKTAASNLTANPEIASGEDAFAMTAEGFVIPQGDHVRASFLASDALDAPVGVSNLTAGMEVVS